MKAAVRFMRQEASTYRIDADHIFGGGYSSGALASIVHGYMSEAELPPEQMTVVDSLGGWEGTQGSPGYSSTVSGIITHAGSVPLSKDHIAVGDVPIFCIHGNADLDTPYAFEEFSPGDTLFGSQYIVNHAQSKGIYSELYTISGGDHDAPKTDYANYIDELMAFLKYIIEQ